MSSPPSDETGQGAGNAEIRTRERSRLEFLGSLAAGLAHEIKNPLSTMTINLQLMKEDWQDSKSPREKKTLAKIEVLQREVKRLEEVLNDFLRFARGPKLRLRDVDLNAVIREMIDFIAPEAARRHVRVQCAFDETIGPVRLDRNLVKQALLNVILNAQQAMEEAGGELIVTTRCEGSRARIDVIDTGAGIAPENLPKIFQVYYSTKRTGTGLGLPTARRYVEEHDGAIDVQSEVGRGTQVTITLPRAGPVRDDPPGDGKD
ncbi:MAG: two-component sensor histidine kinase [Planctomycetes bacterium]|nr:two-component sensor histidine kinase [Planctomycetota bacterium]MBI3848013.1 two-component sensor histidine kinase [Planctomycetota bacterium]